MPPVVCLASLNTMSISLVLSPIARKQCAKLGVPLGDYCTRGFPIDVLGCVGPLCKCKVFCQNSNKELDGRLGCRLQGQQNRGRMKVY